MAAELRKRRRQPQARTGVGGIALQGRIEFSGSLVTVSASVNGNPVRLDYRLIGFEWVLDELGGPIAGTKIP
ncbi:hypothetical protein [Thiohalocapsa sp.]|uniref:hypothetical protein n=1 Tax=Thiohalocapsa sp. TaxID=2497641 RepID=UPI0025E860B4|nr:hypothetical protein [Thiohalocapsa sp.]